METVVAVTIGLLSTIFLMSLVGLILICRHKYCRNRDLISQHHQDTRPDIQLIEDEPSRSKVETQLGDVDLSNSVLTEILTNEHWVDDATGLVPHCIAILKTCHFLTERLVRMTMGNSDKVHTQEMLADIVTVAKRISPRVDEVVQSMYPPLDPRLLEARCTALVLSVSHLVLVAKHACKQSCNMDWIDESLVDVEDHLKILQEASFSLSPDCRSPSRTVTYGDGSHQPMIDGQVTVSSQ